ncbi:MAG: hypothetical protein GKC04_05105 [Methanomicrobiales archaeon]|nr:hypothetical protein [Methanomicrobiales archaeon]
MPMHRALLYLLLEGNDDERFFSSVVNPVLADEGYRIKIWKYAREKRIRTEKFVQAIRADDADYLYVRDIDTAPSVAAKKREIRSWYHHAVAPGRIVIVVTEIESWYLAGLADEGLRHLSLTTPPATTDFVTKEEFNMMIPSGSSRIHFMRDLLARYDMSVAMERNRSFSYFMQRFAPRWVARHQGR